jgi:hypothetical protein
MGDQFYHHFVFTDCLNWSKSLFELFNLCFIVFNCFYRYTGGDGAEYEVESLYDMCG